jgi:hypothetical protein
MSTGTTGVIQSYIDANRRKADAQQAASAANQAAQDSVAAADDAAAHVRSALAAHGPRLIQADDGTYTVWEPSAGDPGFHSFPIELGDVPDDAPPAPVEPAT